MINPTTKVTRAQSKSHNRGLVLKTIYGETETTRADIARQTRLARATVSQAVAELIDEGLVAEIGQKAPNGSGKPATLLRVVDGSRHLIGLDLANHEFRGAVFDLRGRLVHRLSVPVPQSDGDTALRLVYDLTGALLAAATSPVLGLGVGVPGLVDARQGVILETVHLDWQGLPLQDLLQQRYGLPVHIANDCHAAALAEYTFGEHEHTGNLVVLKVGPGVSAGIVVNGRLHYGDGHGAGEIGHVRVVEDGEPCPCGHLGCLETVVSRRVLLQRARAIARSDPHSRLLQFASTPAQITTTDMVLRAFQAGDPAVAEVVGEMGRALGSAVAGLVGVLNIEHILLAGSMARFGEALIAPMQHEMRQAAHARLADRTEIRLSGLGQDIVMLGAAALVLANELGLA